MIITIARQCGCCGDEIGKRLSELFHIPLHNRATICEIAKDKEVYERYPQFFDEYSASTYMSALAETFQEDRIRQTPYVALHTVVGEEQGVVIGRCGNYAYKNADNAVRIFLSGEKEIRIQRIMKTHGISHRKAEELIEKTDENRKAYHKYYTGEDWGYAENYDLCFDEDKIGTDGVVEIVCQYTSMKEKH